MKKITRIVLLISLLAGFAVGADALTLSQVSGSWDRNSVTGGDHVYDHLQTYDVTYGNYIENVIRWGNPAGSFKSGLGFTGFSNTTVNTNEAFAIGNLRHFNHPIFDGSEASSVEFALSLSFLDIETPEVFSLSFGIDETSNKTGDNDKDADFISFSNLDDSRTFELYGIEYTFTLMGFGTDSGSIIKKLTSPENGITSTTLWGQITSTDNTTTNPVPEPATILLVGCGLLGLAGGVKRKRTGC